MPDRLASRADIACVAGHLSSVVVSAAVKRGTLCARCSGRDHPEPTVYYVATGGGMVKPGISSGDGRGRLDTHRVTHGIDRTRRLVTGLPVGVARSVEGHVLDRLALEGVRPVRGYEYFGAEHADRVMALADERFTENFPELRWDVTA
ncbi:MULTISPECIES: hypothetical protein [unclassified Streptomyces]|uniref:hypothetical protein n=1 Tax=unclassified Streptomyces TaxID=2593676 RepID=UPI0006FE910A|nr:MULTISPECIES: hypothetical protein [unclassified Streptomyces]KQX50976.1 hypothetical protein ASD33_13300 [Streptomyces sp. Root1304]KRA85142.1 hypothetical protein ASE09_13305 [Streptomyces sp. Root66D1]